MRGEKSQQLSLRSRCNINSIDSDHSTPSELINLKLTLNELPHPHYPQPCLHDVAPSARTLFIRSVLKFKLSHKEHYLFVEQAVNERFTMVIHRCVFTNHLFIKTQVIVRNLTLISGDFPQQQLQSHIIFNK